MISNDKGFLAFIVAWFLFLVLDLAILAGIVYVVVHFLGKVW